MYIQYGVFLELCSCHFFPIFFFCKFAFALLIQLIPIFTYVQWDRPTSCYVVVDGIWWSLPRQSPTADVTLLCEREVTILIMLWIVHCHMWCVTVQSDPARMMIVQYGAIVLQYETPTPHYVSFWFVIFNWIQWQIKSTKWTYYWSYSAVSTVLSSHNVTLNIYTDIFNYFMLDGPTIERKGGKFKVAPSV